MSKRTGLALVVVYLLSLYTVITVLAVRVWNQDQHQENANVESTRVVSTAPRGET